MKFNAYEFDIHGRILQAEDPATGYPGDWQDVWRDFAGHPAQHVMESLWVKPSWGEASGWAYPRQAQVTTDVDIPFCDATPFEVTEAKWAGYTSGSRWALIYTLSIACHQAASGRSQRPDAVNRMLKVVTHIRTLSYKEFGLDTSQLTPTRPVNTQAPAIPDGTPSAVVPDGRIRPADDPPPMSSSTPSRSPRLFLSHVEIPALPRSGGGKNLPSHIRESEELTKLS